MENFNKANLQTSLSEPLKEPNPKDPAVNAPVTPNEYGGIYDKSKKPQISFIQSRLNKDNFWNLMFFVGMNLGFGIAGLILSLTNNATSFSIAMWITLLSVPYVVKKNSSITFDKEKLQFLNRNNEVLNDRAPNFFLLLIATFAGCGATVVILESLKNFIYQPLAFSIFVMMITFIPTVYCILKNFPIAVYFKKETYIGDGTARSFSSTGGIQGRHHADNSILSLSSLRNSPINSWYSGNIYHRDR